MDKVVEGDKKGKERREEIRCQREKWSWNEGDYRRKYDEKVVLESLTRASR